MLFQPGQEGLIADQAVFDHFGEAGGELARCKRAQRRSIDDHGPGLVEGTDHVLAQRVVDAGLAADGGVHLGQQGGRHLDEIDTTLVAGRREAGHVTDHATTQCDDGGAAIVTGGEQAVEDQLQGFPVLEGFTVGQDDRLHLVGGKRAGQLFEIERGDGRVGDDGHLLAGDMGREKLDLRQQASADMDGITTLAKIDLKCPHGAPTMKRALG